MAGIAVVLVMCWTVVGLVRGFTAHHWLDVLYAGTGAITFVMVFMILHTNSRETRAVLLKLDELIRANENARDQFIAAEHRPLHEQDRLEAANRP